MIKNTISIIITVLVATITIVGSTYALRGHINFSYYNKKNNLNDIFKQTKIGELLVGLEEHSKIDFSSIGKTDFEWNIGEEKIQSKLEVNGLGFAAKNISQEVDIVNSFFHKNGYKQNSNNTSSGKIGGLYGFIKNNIACLLFRVNSDFDPDNPYNTAMGNKNDIEVQCGEIDEDVVNRISTENIFEKLIAENNNKDISEIIINITNETETHARGLCDKGKFFAVKQEEDWRIVFMGAGNYFCEEMEMYDFPLDMIADCVFATNADLISEEEKDVNGCLLNQGYRWCYSKQKCLRTWEEECFELENYGNKDKQAEAAALEISKNYIENLEKYKENIGRNLSLLESIREDCPGCWEFEFEFNIDGEDEGVINCSAQVYLNDWSIKEISFNKQCESIFKEK